jgi:hypothetical protein
MDSKIIKRKMEKHITAISNKIKIIDLQFHVFLLAIHQLLLVL